VADYSSGSLSALAVQADGSLAGPVETLSHVGHGPNPERQKAAHVHMVLPSPDNQFLFATDLGEDRVYAYRCEPGSQAFPLRRRSRLLPSLPQALGHGIWRSARMAGRSSVNSTRLSAPILGEKLVSTT
jgi:6-phosphogluconolactonase